MIKHYLKIAVRNALKYKAQTLISICAIAVSVSLFVLVTSLLLRIHPHPIYEMTYIDNVVSIYREQNNFDKEHLNLILSHNFKSVETIIPNVSGYWANLASVVMADQSLQSKLTEGQIVDGRLLNFLGYKSDVTGDNLPIISGDTIIVSRKFAEKFFGNSKSAIGQEIIANDNNKKISYHIKDVKSDSYLNDNFFRSSEMFIPLEHIAEGYYCTHIIAKLRDGFTKDDLTNEISDLLPDAGLMVYYYKDMGKEDQILYRVREGIVVFLFLFLMVSVVSFLRQKLQLFGIRQREIALRTVLGSKKNQLFEQFFLEVSIVLTVSVLLSLILSYILKAFLLSRYSLIISEINWRITGIFSTTIMIYFVLTMVSAISVKMHVDHIKNNRIGLALQMKPHPKHRLRNIGLTVQLTISMIFTWISLLALNSSFSLDKSYKIPENDAYYKEGISLKLNYVSPSVGENVHNILKKSEAIERIYCEQLEFKPIVLNDEEGEYNDYIKVFIQRTNEMTDFYNIEIRITNTVANPSLNVAVSEKLKRNLEKNGKWNNQNITIDNVTYDIIGTYEHIPYDIIDRPSIILTDESYIPHNLSFYIIPKHGKRGKAKKDVEEAIKQTIPSRIDIVPEKLYSVLSPYSTIREVIQFVIFVITLISVVTTMASLYASVTLDTRRRRKEMALRKINGAKTTDICRIFAKTYVWITIIAGIITISVCGIATKIRLNDPEYFPHPLQDCFIAIVFVIAITFTTITWKIREVMKVDPAEYLKE